ncbi:hypothetical protein MKW98_000902 [Papaver atlanticum]|uniref:Inositol-tetrakisphosphate 1-kinase n=1 Tax=Papaver atlanticum TaxID=357466 RepID=A0AAD4SEE0_9MAGN|nr:hypothetical protein MKW98_000902 [Papaver atlanticum]
MTRRYSIGYALASKKQKSFIQDSLVNQSRERGIDLIKIDSDKLLIDQGPFDCILHKLSGENWVKQLDDYVIKNPNVLIIDSPNDIEIVHNRISMLQVVSDLKICEKKEENGDAKGATFGIPKQMVINDVDSLMNPCGMEDHGLKFPVIAKPLVADGSAKSHKMALVYNRDGLDKLKPPIVLQEFVNHGGVIFKVYVVGDYVKCVKRKSLPDISEEQLVGNSEEGTMSFSQISNMTTQNRADGKNYYEIMHIEDVVMPPDSLITDIARGLRQAMRLHLFNFDVIRDSKIGDHYLVIDINYFPGYAKMPCYEPVLTDFFCDLIQGKQNFGNEGVKKEEDGCPVTESVKEERTLVSNNGSTDAGEEH